MKKTFLLLFTICIITDMSMAQSWQYAGPKEGMSTDSENGMDVVLSPAGIPFVAFSDDQNNAKATVMSFSGSNWNIVGTAGFSPSPAYDISLAFGPSGIPYVTYKDASTGYKVSVMRFINGNWTTLGIAGFSPDAADLIGNIVFSPSGTPFVSYMDYSEAVTVMSFDGANWGLAGDADFVYSFFCNLVFSPSGNLYMAICDNGIGGGKTSVLSFTGSNWSVVGAALFSPGYSQDISLAFNPEGVPFVAFQDWANHERATVMSLSGSNWSIVGTAGFSMSTTTTNGVENTMIAFSPSGTLYLAYSDMDINTGNTGKTNVTYFNNGNWSISGAGGVTQSNSYVQKIVFNSAGIPYVGLLDGETSVAKVVSFNGTNWGQVGPKAVVGFSDGDMSYSSLAFNHSGVPYVAYVDIANNSKATVKSFDGSDWNTVGIEGFSTGQVNYTSLAINSSGTLYVAYSDYANHNKATVMSFDGSNWGNVGNAGFSPGDVYYTNIALSPSGAPYVTFSDHANHDKASVMSFDGSNWSNVGSAGFSVSDISKGAITFSSAGIPYVTFGDGGYFYAARVMSFDGSNWGNVGSPGFSQNYITPPVLAISPSGVPYVAFGSEVTVMSFDGSNWSVVGTAGFSSGSDYVSLAFNASGIPYVAYQDGDTKATISYLSNGNWSVAGTAGFSQGTVQYVNLAFNPVTDVPFVAYEGFAGGAVAQYFDKDSQTITGLSVQNVSLSGANVVLILPEMASSGLSVSYSIVSTPTDIATINGNLLTVSNVGTVTVTATQIGNAAYIAADPVIISFTVSTISGITSTITGPSTIVSSINNPEVSAVKLYPNPVKGMLNITGITVGSTIELINSLGNTVSLQKADTDAAFDLSNYSPGLYLVKVTSGTRSKIFRIVKE